MYLVSVTKRRSITVPSGAVNTFTLLTESSSSQRTFVTSIKEIKKKKFNEIKIYNINRVIAKSD